jgi:glutamate/tyrosine decarboxylase-like PLP-dependent enzyme
MTVGFPVRGRSWRSLRKQMKHMCKDDLNWRRGRHSAYVWYANDEIKRVAQNAYNMFMTENGLGKRVFHSLRQMHADVVQMVLVLLGGPDGAGQMSSGGTESIFLATKAARDWARQRKPHVKTPEIIAPHSAHPAINKTAHYLGMKIKRVPVGSDFRADPHAMAAAVTSNTVMLYASAPAFSLGVIDPVEQMGVAAQKHNLWLHVDACVGGILGPFVRRLGHPVPGFDFSVPGVSSISADLHKSGYTPKGASTVLFRSPELQEYSGFDFDDWPSGRYQSLTFTGTNPGGAIAAAWAVMNYLGEEGYLRIAETVMNIRRHFEANLRRLKLHVWGKPDLWAVAYGSDIIDIMTVASEMRARGWAVAPVRRPPGIHFMPTPVHEPYIKEYFSALEASIDAVGRTSSAAGMQVDYA